jgi:hypothetical protein
VQQTGNTISAQPQKKLYIQNGAIESCNGNKFILRKVSSKIEFFINDSTLVLLKMAGTFSDIKEKNYIVVKGPHNKNTILANSVYIYNNKNECDLFSEEKKSSETSTRYSFVLEGYVIKTEPFLTISSDSSNYVVSCDEDTKFIINKITSKDDIKPGDSVTLFFDKIISIRYDNYPVKMIINKIKIGE